MSKKASILKSIGGKILILFLSVSLTAIAAVTVISIFMSSKALKTKAFDQLLAIQKIKKSQIQTFFNERIGDVKVYSNNDVVINAVIEFEQAFEEEGGVRGEKWNLLDKKYGPQLKYYMDQYGYYDIFLIAEDGDILYTVAKENDLGQNLITGELSESVISKAFKTGKLKANFTDFEWYDVSNEPASFVAAPIKNNNNKLKGVLVYQISLSAINNIMQEREGMGKTGETYLVGPDKKMRSDSYLDPEGHSVKASFSGTVEKNGVNTEAVIEGLKGNSGEKIITDYNGNPVLSCWDSIKIGDVTWIILAEIDEAEINKPIYNLIYWIVGIAVFIFILVLIISIIFSSSISKPLKIVTKVSDRIADGDLRQEKLILKSGDEIGILAESFNKMIESLQYKMKIVENIARGAGDFTIDVKLASENDIFGKTIIDMLDSLNNIIGQVKMASNQISIGSTQVSSASQTLSQGATEQASSLEEITSSITEINSQSKQNSENAESANKLAKQAKDNALDGNNLMTELVNAMDKINTSSDEIKKIVKVIDDIAFQTNLLALNANVEAARAGKYGKGFAVVAEEVRNLASRSAEAVKETTQMVEDSIKNILSSNDLVEKTAKQLGQIVKGADEVVNLVEEITLASREQSQGLDQINTGLDQIDQVTQSNTANAEESASAAEELSSQAQQLKALVSKFRIKELSYKDKEQIKLTHKKKLQNKINNEIIQDQNSRNEVDIKKIDNNIVMSKYPEQTTLTDTVDDQDFGKF